MASRASRGRREQARLLLEELVRVAEALGLEVRQEKLLREVGYRVRSGACRVRETRLVLLDRDLDVEGRIEVLVDVLSRCPLEGVYVSPAVRELLERRRTRLAG